MEINEEIIIKKLCANDIDAYTMLINMYSSKLKKAAYIMLKDEDLAEDIVQDTYLRFYYNIQNFRGESSLYTYLYKILLNECRQKMRKKWFKNIISIDKVIGDKNRTESFEKIKINCMTIKTCLFKLDIKYREIIYLHYYEDMSIKEISNITGINKNTIKTRLKRGRDILEKYLKEAGFDYE